MAFSITYGDLNRRDPNLASQLQKGLRRLMVNGQPGDADLADNTEISETFLQGKLSQATHIKSEPKTPEDEARYDQLFQNVGNVANQAQNELDNQRNQTLNNQQANGTRTPNPINAQTYPLAQPATNDDITAVQKLIKTREDALSTDGADIADRQEKLDKLLKQRKDHLITLALEQSGNVHNTDDLAFIVRFLSQITATAIKNQQTLREQRKLEKQISTAKTELAEKHRTYNTNYKELGNLDRRLNELATQAAREQQEANARARAATTGQNQNAGATSSASPPDPSHPNSSIGVDASGQLGAPESQAAATATPTPVVGVPTSGAAATPVGGTPPDPAAGIPPDPAVGTPAGTPDAASPIISPTIDNAAITPPAPTLSTSAAPVSPSSHTTPDLNALVPPAPSNPEPPPSNPSDVSLSLNAGGRNYGLTTAPQDAFTHAAAQPLAGESSDHPFAYQASPPRSQIPSPHPAPDGLGTQSDQTIQSTQNQGPRPT